MSESGLKFHGACRPWTGATDSNGYGRQQVGKHWLLAHRIVWQERHGEIAAGMQIDHLCRNRLCVNTDHLEVVTLKENVLRGTAPSAINARKTHCIKGHPLTGDNLESERRRCKTCARARWRAYRQRKIDAGTWPKGR